jgi:hypothetical protein
MESNTIKAAIDSRIAELSYVECDDAVIAEIVQKEMPGITVTAKYVAQVIADFMADQFDGERYNEPSDEGYDPYMNTYTDDC